MLVFKVNALTKKLVAERTDSDGLHAVPSRQHNWLAGKCLPNTPNFVQVVLLPSVFSLSFIYCTHIRGAGAFFSMLVSQGDLMRSLARCDADPRYRA